MPIVVTGHDAYSGRVVDNGHCVRYLQIVGGGQVGHTSTWRRGVPARGGNLAPGTAIATFDKNGRYANATDGSSHAAILIAENSDGLLVWDQYQGKSVGQRVLRYRGGQGNAANDGDAFYAIETA